MKKIILSILLFFALIAYAQPTLNASDFPSAYYAIGYRPTTMNFTNGPSGANVIWDYSATALIATGVTYSIVPPNTSGNSSTYPTANFCEKYDYNGSLEYSLYVLNNQSLELIAVSNSTFTINYTYNPGVIYNFPYTFLNTTDDTIWSFGSSSPPEPVLRTYDSYGTLITPYATYTNVIRQKMVNVLGHATYYWLNTNPYQILMRGNFDNGTGGVTFFRDSRLSNNQLTTTTFKIYPNPTSNSFSITTNDIVTVKVYDVLGKLMLQNNDYISDTAISLSDFAKGVYIIKIIGTDSTLLSTEKIIRN